MSGRPVELWTWLAMRLSSVVLALAVTIHLATMIIVIQNGLSAEEILERTRGSLVWYAFYIIFVIVAAVHGAIGLRNIVREHTPWRGSGLNIAASIFALLLLVLGL